MLTVVQFRDNFSRFPKNRLWFGPLLLPFSRWQVYDLIFQPQKNEEGNGSSVFGHGWKSMRSSTRKLFMLAGSEVAEESFTHPLDSSDGIR